MTLTLWQIDAFVEKPFAGNPAAVIPLESWLPDAMLQAIAGENNLSETAFFVRRDAGRYDLRWFTPAAEVELCGHATLAAAWLIFAELAPELDRVAFKTRKSGTLTVARGPQGRHAITLPADKLDSFEAPPNFAEKLGQALSAEPPFELVTGRYLMAAWIHGENIRDIRFSEAAARLLHDSGKWGLIVTGRGDAQPYDFVSRFFAPEKGVLEDPVTGSAHCMLVPYWSRQLLKKELHAYQASERGGEILCTDNGETVRLSGGCALYMKGEIFL